MDSYRDRHGGLFVVLLVLLAWLPIPLGSNRPWSWSLMEFAILSIVGLWLLCYVHRPFRVSPAVGAGAGPVLIGCVWIGYVGAQSLPLAPNLVGALSPTTSALYGDVGSMDGGDGFPLSIDAGASTTELLKIAAYLAFFFATAVLVTSRRRLRLILSVLALVGVANALFGLATYFAPGWAQPWYPAKSVPVVAGTYANRNHFAGLMEMAIAAGLGLLWADGARVAFSSNWRGRVRGLTELALRPSGRLVFYLVVLCSGLILSLSRGGLGALFIGLCVVLGINLMRRGAGAMALSMGLWASMVFLLAVAWLGAGNLAHRLQAEGLQSNRPEIWARTLAMIEERPVFGSGAGTFQWQFPAYKNRALGSRYYHHAHNDYLELVADQGMVGLALAGALVGLIYVRIWRAFLRRRDRLMRGALLASLVGTTSLMIHALVDFNFHIPANAAYFATLLGIGLAASVLDTRGASEAPV